MYRAVVKTARPWVYCGKGDTRVDVTASRPMFVTSAALAAEAKRMLKKDVISQCSRIGICSRFENAQLTEDVSHQCNMRPSKYKLACARKESCLDVVTCSKQ